MVSNILICVLEGLRVGLVSLGSLFGLIVSAVIWLLSTRNLVNWLLSIHSNLALVLFSMFSLYDLTALYSLPGCPGIVSGIALDEVTLRDLGLFSLLSPFGVRYAKPVKVNQFNI